MMVAKKNIIPINSKCIESMKRHVVIIGNGISGITCARNIRKLSKCRITVISSESEYFYSRTALMYVYMGHMKMEHLKPYEDSFWKMNNIDCLHNKVERIDTSKRTLHFLDSTQLPYDVLVIATGSKSNKFGWPGQNLIGVQGLYNLNDLEEIEKNTQGISKAVIVGGGLIGIEMAEMLKSRNISVTFLVREKSFWNNILPPEESQLINRHIAEHHIDLRFETELKEIKSDAKGKVEAIITNKDEVMNCSFVGLTVGVSPQIDFLHDSGIELQRGVLINNYFQTNIPDVYAIGDCAQFREPLSGRKPIEQVWYTGRAHGKTVAKTICGIPTSYNPGQWFNSAKFFDIEYQICGNINTLPGEKEETFYWEHSGGKIGIRFNYERDNGKLLGINSLGMRLRMAVITDWLNEGKAIDYALEHLKDANFDPEFYQTYEDEIITKYNNDEKHNLRALKKDWTRIAKLTF